MWVLALLAFGIAAFLALASIPGVTLLMVVGIIAIGPGPACPGDRQVDTTLATALNLD
jgi:hypothetical protein